MVEEWRAREIWAEERRRFGIHSWKFEVRDVPEMGLCLFHLKLIIVSRELCVFNGEDEVRDTVRHEVAHAISGDETHGPRWRAACDRVGCRPEPGGWPRGPNTAWSARCASCGFLGHGDGFPDLLAKCPRCDADCDIRRT